MPISTIYPQIGGPTPENAMPITTVSPTSPSPFRKAWDRQVAQTYGFDTPIDLNHASNYNPLSPHLNNPRSRRNSSVNRIARTNSVPRARRTLLLPRNKSRNEAQFRTHESFPPHQQDSAQDGTTDITPAKPPLKPVPLQTKATDTYRPAPNPNFKYGMRGNSVKPVEQRRSPHVAPTNRRSPCRAVLVAMTYIGTKGVSNLPKDIQHMQELFDLLTTKLGYRKEDIWVLTDLPRQMIGTSVQIAPTRNNLLNAMKWLVGASSAGDKLFFGFSGHGVEVSKTENRVTIIDECLLPVDYPDAPPIPQATVSSLLVNELHAQATLTAIIDCKRPYNILRLPYLYVTHRTSRKRWVAQETLQYDEALPETLRAVTFSSFIRNSRYRRDYIQMRRRAGQVEREMLANSVFVAGRAVTFSGCADHLDFTDGEPLRPLPHGSLTSAIVSYISQNVDQDAAITYRTILQAVGPVIAKRRGSQMLQVSMSHRMNLDNAPFFL